MMSDVDDYEREIDDLHNWFKENKNLPHDIDRLLLKRFFQCMYYNVDDTKKLIEVNYVLRNKHPNIFIKRDPSDMDSCNTFDYVDMVSLPGLTPEGYRVSCYRLCDTDPNKVHHTEDTKAFFLVADCRFSMPDTADDPTLLSKGEVQIFDMSGYTMKHITKLTIGTLRIYLNFLKEAYPVHLKAIHLINCPPYWNKILAVLRPFISKDVLKLIHPHTKGVESLHEFIPIQMLPEEYGGNIGSLNELKKKALQELSAKREYLMDPNYWEIENS